MEQIIDTLLADDPERYRIYESIRAQRPWGNAKTGRDDEIYRYAGMFLTRWVQLEGQLIALFGSTTSGGRPFLPTTRNLVARDILGERFIREFDYLRRMRNNLVHGIEIPPPDVLEEATRMIDILIDELKRYGQGPGDLTDTPE